MNIRDNTVLETINKLIAKSRYNKFQVLQLVNLLSVSKDIGELKENLKWEPQKKLLNKDKAKGIKE